MSVKNNEKKKQYILGLTKCLLIIRNQKGINYSGELLIEWSTVYTNEFRTI